MTSLLKISEQCLELIGIDKTNLQSLQELVKQSYSDIAKLQWYENYADGVNEINGSFIYTFNNIDAQYDSTQNRYYITLPSSYLELPHEMGINFIGYNTGSDDGFVRLPSGSLSLFKGLQSYYLGNRQVYTVEGSNIYFDKMDKVSSKGELMLKLAIAFDTVNIDDQLNISPSMVGRIIDSIVAKYNPVKPQTLNTL